TVLSMEGYEVVEAAKGTMGLDLLYRTFPHAVLLDLRMPILGGMGILEILKDKSGLREVPVICVTAATDEFSMYEALYRGADAYLFKPIKIDLLKLVLRFLLEERDRPSRARELAGYGRAREFLDLVGRDVDHLPKLEALLVISSRGRIARHRLDESMVYGGGDLACILEEMVESGILVGEGEEIAVSEAWRARARRIRDLAAEHRGLELLANLVHMGINLFETGAPGAETG
ncbi:MAG: response regulator, partial [Actinomycetota bacterium]|nr:response regulator [Actinomycetota bacterium]